MTAVHSAQAPGKAGHAVPMLIRTRKGLSAARAALPEPVVLVPTMGALHDGHRSPLRRARELAGPEGSVLVSIFVNPLQFGQGEDFERYPRSLEQDLAVCAEEGVSAVFSPDRAQMYPAEPVVTVNPGPLGRILEGKSRPGFFDGVLTVVLKLFQLTRPYAGVFGAKDAQQLALIRQMVTDLDVGVRIESAPLFRDPDGLAASSRNSYLSPAERTSALALSEALAAACALAAHGTAAVLAAARGVLAAAASASPPVELDYLVLVDARSFTEVGLGYRGPATLLVAAKVGGTRLIDNISIEIGSNPA
ncbi:MAG TPA: pantoate--beta-alanine ligase [Streptosporangiaceae bacterium]|jgi:pantoate--beta-alanine ligase|nr:pantoate--beta-alanine ligase [Streptosporangiaceae bacterium]